MKKSGRGLMLFLAAGLFALFKAFYYAPRVSLPGSLIANPADETAFISELTSLKL